MNFAFDIIYKDNNHMANIKDIPKEIINDDCVKDIINFLNSDKKRPICTSQDNNENN